ncbi:uncharacterized protein HMPREF1541_01517 [Cyphellophora europaea CBS 101466]|uniref:Uncharacterized protein n=1 Tax=Cyphellophora europaea (strain CBS 101466) TaxID=1220924 RepID=W2S2W3_CYPE1|nr:uncharacterized protein HMPREF1541_01517 [Cyphellophora europaea CBS 101466]ETN42363.1 hypothetical protein HMPREF1541_01517 [Cyphellophora europaea CBS 101466]
MSAGRKPNSTSRSKSTYGAAVVQRNPRTRSDGLPTATNTPAFIAPAPLNFRATMPHANFDNPWYLRSLLGSTSISILYQRDMAADPIILFEEFPKLVAIHFSNKWRPLFPVGPATTPADISALHPRAITIVGGRPEAHLAVLQWMLTACDGGGLKDWPFYIFSAKPFCTYYHLRRAAQVIGCVFLEDEFHLRMQALSDKRIHSDDIEAVYNEVARGSPMATHLVEHVASFFVEKGMHHTNGPYWRLRQRNRAFDEDVTVRIGFRYERDPELARAWNERNKLAKEEALEGEGVMLVEKAKFEKAKVEEVKTVEEQETVVKVKDKETAAAKIEVEAKQEQDPEAKAKPATETETETEAEAKAEAEAEPKATKAKETVELKINPVIGVDAVEQALNVAGKIKNKAARRREKKRLAKVDA